MIWYGCTVRCIAVASWINMIYASTTLELTRTLDSIRNVNVTPTNTSRYISVKTWLTLWQWRDDSTVRTDNAAFTYDQSIEGYVKNKVYAFNNVSGYQRHSMIALSFFIMSGLTHIFIKYLKAMIRAPKQVKHVHKWAKVYIIRNSGNMLMMNIAIRLSKPC